MSKHHVFREYYEAILVAVIFTLFARTFVAQAFKIPTGSMEDNLLVGDHLFVNKFIYAPHWDTPIHRAMPYRDIDLSKRWQEYDISHDLTSKGMERFSADWNLLIK
jgi:signal peptidase I